MYTSSCAETGGTVGCRVLMKYVTSSGRSSASRPSRIARAVSPTAASCAFTGEPVALFFRRVSMSSRYCSVCATVCTASSSCALSTRPDGEPGAGDSGVAAGVAAAAGGNGSPAGAGGSGKEKSIRSFGLP